MRRSVAALGVALVLLIGMAFVAPAAEASAGAFNWAQANGAATPPGQIDPAAAFDPGSGHVIMYGGLSGDETTVDGDTWEWDGGNWTQLSPAHSPGPLQQAALAYDTSSSQLILFGGEAHAVPDYPGLNNNTWRWTGTDWQQLSPVDSPPLLSGVAMAYDPGSQTLVLYGGYTGSGVSNQTWLWNGTDWTQFPSAGGPTGGLAFASLAYDSATNQLILYGGLNSSNAETNGTWIWNDGSDTWTQLSPAQNPGNLAATALVNEPGNGLILYGGRIDSSHISNQTWRWTGTTWAQLSPSTVPGPGLVAMGSAYDTATQNVLLYGGYDGSTADNWNDTWLGGLTPAFTSSASATFQAGVFSSFTVTTSGAPIATVSNPDTLPAGLTFTPNSNGTATISGTPTAGTAAGSYQLHLGATSSVGSDAQTLTLTVTPAARHISFGATPSGGVTVGQTFTPTATSSSGGAVTLTVDPASAGACSMNPVTGVVTALTGGTCQIDATQAGNAQYQAGSAMETVTLLNAPVITATLSSSKPPRAGWYRTPVTVTFACNPGSGTLTAACPAPVTLTASATQTVTRIVTSSTGVSATVIVTIHIDRAAPSITFLGTKPGHSSYTSVPKIRCAAHDKLSGVASCKLTKRVGRTSSGETITYTATATDRAGNVKVSHLTITVLR